MDVDSIAHGVDFTESVIEAVSGCNILIALIGRDWLAITDSEGRRRIDNPDDWVRIEIETALKSHIPVVPVLVDGAALPQLSDLPPSLQPLIRRQALQLTHTGFRAGVEILSESINEIFGDVQGGPQPAYQRWWRLNLLDQTGTKSTFRLSSGTEVHEITVTHDLGIQIEADGKLEGIFGVLKGGDISLKGLSSALKTEVTIQVYMTGDEEPMAVGQIKWLVVKIGDVILTYPRRR
jgi:hypothetical protein